MSTDRDTTRIVRSWLRTDENDSADRVLGDVLARLDTTPQRRAPWWPARRLSDMNTTLKLGLAAAVVAVAVLVGINYVGSPNVGGPGPAESTTPSTPEPTPTATAVPAQSPAPENLLPEGPHALVDGEVVDEPPPMTVTIPAPDWYHWDPGTMVKNNDPSLKGGAWIVVFLGDLPVWKEEGPCDSRSFTLATTVDELVAALTAPSSRDATEPVDVTVDGYAGKSITLRAPDDISTYVDPDEEFSTCHPRNLFSGWRTPGPPGEDYYRDPFTHWDAGLTDKLWILDVDGLLVVIDTVYYEDAPYYEDTPQQVVDEMEAIVGSITFGD